MLKFLTLPLFSLANCYLRGGGLKSFWPHKDGSERDIPGLGIAFFVITALCIYLSVGLDWRIISGTLGMWLAMSWGWGAYIGVLSQNTTWKPHAEVKWIDWLIRPLEKHPRLWGVAGLTIRGLLIGVILATTMLKPIFIPLGATMGILYLIGMNSPFKGNRYFNNWGFSEMLFGLALSFGFVL